MKTPIINSRVNKLQYTLTLNPIYDVEMKIEEITLVFQELKKSRNLAGKSIERSSYVYF